jgi:hypothetical protein
VTVLFRRTRCGGAFVAHCPPFTSHEGRRAEMTHRLSPAPAKQPLVTTRSVSLEPHPREMRHAARLFNLSVSEFSN